MSSTHRVLCPCRLCKGSRLVSQHTQRQHLRKFQQTPKTDPCHDHSDGVIFRCTGGTVTESDDQILGEL